MKFTSASFFAEGIEIGQFINITGGRHPRQFYRPFFNLKHKILSRLPLRVNLLVQDVQSFITPRRLKSVIENIFYKPNENNGTYEITGVIDETQVEVEPSWKKNS